MTTPIQKLGYSKSITVLDSGRASVHDFLRQKLAIPEDISLDNVVSIRESDDSSLLAGKEYFLKQIPKSKSNEEVSYELVVDKQKALVNKLRAEIETTQNLNEHYVVKEKDYHLDLLPQENHALEILRNTSNILDRAFNRRTTLSSWLLFGYLATLGFKGDDFNEIKGKVQEPEFVKKYHQYLVTKELNPKKALSLFNEKEQKLVKLYSAVSGFYKKLNLGFVRWFPVGFTIQNISMPWVAKIFSTGIINKLANGMMILNPWINEFTENLGNYFIEVGKLQEGFNKVLSDKAQPKEEKSLDVDSTIKLSKFNSKENTLNNIVSKMNEALERLFGKKNTVSSLCLNAVLKVFLGENYQTFASQFVDNEGYIKKFATHLEQENKQTDKAPEVFKKGSVNEYAAKVIAAGVRFVKSMPRETMKRITNRFGLTYAILNPLMPLLAHVFKKGPISWVVHTLRDIGPLFNDLLVDHLANFRKEILDIKTETEKDNVKELFPEFDTKNTVGSVIDNARSLWDTIRSFARKFNFRAGTAGI